MPSTNGSLFNDVTGVNQPGEFHLVWKLPQTFDLVRSLTAQLLGQGPVEADGFILLRIVPTRILKHMESTRNQRQVRSAMVPKLSLPKSLGQRDFGWLGSTGETSSHSTLHTTSVLTSTTSAVQETALRKRPKNDPIRSHGLTAGALMRVINDTQPMEIPFSHLDLHQRFGCSFGSLASISKTSKFKFASNIRLNNNTEWPLQGQALIHGFVVPHGPVPGFGRQVFVGPVAQEAAAVAHADEQRVVADLKHFAVARG